MIKQLLKLTILITLTVVLTACGESSDDAPNAIEIDPSAVLLAPCVNTNGDKGFATATDVTSKSLHKLTTQAKVNVWDLNDGTKKACSASGIVEIL